MTDRDRVEAFKQDREVRVFSSPKLRRDIPSLLLYYYLLEASHEVQSTLKGRGLHKDVNTRSWKLPEPSCRLPIMVLNKYTK